MSKRFIKKVENFVCEHCENQVKGDGYTNHCPKCLWCKHVDENPGDRASNCKGMMEPVAIEQKNGEFRIRHKCQKCASEKVNKTQRDDNTEEIIKISSTRVTKRDY